MRFNDAYAYFYCSLANRPDMVACLRQKAQFFMRLSTTVDAEARAALEKLSLDLMDEASALEKEMAIPPASQ